MRFDHASIAASTHSEIGIAEAPRAHVTMRSCSNTAAGTLSTPVPVSWTHLHARGLDPSQRVVPAQVPAEEGVGLQPGRRIAVL